VRHSEIIQNSPYLTDQRNRVLAASLFHTDRYAGVAVQPRDRFDIFIRVRHRRNVPEINRPAVSLNQQDVTNLHSKLEFTGNSYLKFVSRHLKISGGNGCVFPGHPLHYDRQRHVVSNQPLQVELNADFPLTCA